MWSIPGAGTAYPALQVGVSPLPLHGEKKPLGKWGGGAGPGVLSRWRAHVSPRHVEMRWERTRLHTELMKAERISSSSRSPSS